MSKALVWDYPTRLFHWALTVGFAIAFAIAVLAGHRSAWFPVHMILGLALGVVAVLRIIWGFVGTRYARFGSLLFAPTALAGYLRGAVTGQAPRFAGHNPGSAYATFAILALTLITAGTGLLMSRDVEAAEELHELAAYALAAVAVVHIAGVAWHSWRHRENLAASMVTGAKETEGADEEIASPRPVAGIVFALIIATATVGLFRNYDQQRHETKLPLLGTPIHLGEEEHH